MGLREYLIVKSGLGKDGDVGETSGEQDGYKIRV